MWFWTAVSRDNRTMDLSPSQIEELETALEQLEALDPASLPEPAAQLADLLGKILDDMDQH